MTNAMLRLPLFLVVGAFLALAGCSEDNDAVTPFEDATGAPDVSGVVRDGGGAPLENAVVTLQPTVDGIAATVAAMTGDTPALARAAAQLRTTSTDALGRFAFDEVDAGTWLLEARKDHHLAASQLLRRAPGDTTVVDVQLTPTGTFTGNVLREGAAEHQGSVVYVEGTSYVAVSDPAGDYAIAGVPIGTATIRAQYPGFLEDSTVDSLASAGEVVVLEDLFLARDANIAPTASITIDPGPYVAGQPVGFTAVASDPDGTIVSYEWDFEDDGTVDGVSTLATTVNTYATSGAYTIKLRVIDDDGAVGLAATTIDVSPAALFVATTGSPAGAGTKNDPLNSVDVAVALAAAEGIPEVRVASGNYSESLTLLPGIDVTGSLDPLNDWQPAVSQVTTITAAAPGTSTQAASIDVPTVVRDVTFAALDNPSGNSVALRVQSSAGGLLFESCTFRSGNAADGQSAGGTGQNGQNGGLGSNGQPGTCDGPLGLGGAGGTGACPGGAGGRGGSESGSGTGVPGAPGFCSGGAGGSPGGSGDPGGDGSPGQNGAPGVDGSGGSSASAVGTILSGNWVPSTSGNGANGTDGRGGGGGGGGGAQQGTFVNDGGGNGGGGGGGGGSRGTGGSGGQGGFASIAVVLIGADVEFVDCVFETGDAGDGAPGGQGGTGGAGGLGGSGGTACLAEIGQGGNGGRGGRGGHGGGGAGGPGGPTFGVLLAANSQLTESGSTFALGTPGSGGAGGFSPGNAGAAGANGVATGIVQY